MKQNYDDLLYSKERQNAKILQNQFEKILNKYGYLFVTDECFVSIAQGQFNSVVEYDVFFQFKKENNYGIESPYDNNNKSWQESVFCQEYQEIDFKDLTNISQYFKDFEKEFIIDKMK